MANPVLEDFTLARDQVVEAKALLGRVVQVQKHEGSADHPVFGPSTIVNVDLYSLESFRGGPEIKWVSLSLQPQGGSERWWMVIDHFGVNVVVTDKSGRETLPGKFDPGRSGFATVEAIGDIGQAAVAEGGKNISRAALIVNDQGNCSYACFERFTGGGNYSFNGWTINRASVKVHALG